MSKGGSPQSDGASLPDRVIELIDRLAVAAPEKTGPETELFELALLDSLALVELVLWVENEMGGAVDLSSVDFQKEWATVGDLVAFIQRGAGPDAKGQRSEG